MVGVIGWVAHLSYAQWLRAANPSTLTRYEQRSLQSDLDWVAENPALAKTLDSLIGKTWPLATDRTSHTGRLYKKGTPIRIVDRWQGVLHGYAEGTGVLLLIHPEWIDSTKPLKTPPLAEGKRNR